MFKVEFLRRGRSELFRTESGLLGTGPRSVQVGDSVWIVPGVRVPMILPQRRTKKPLPVPNRQNEHDNSP